MAQALLWSSVPAALAYVPCLDLEEFRATTLAVTVLTACESRKREAVELG